MDGSPSSSTTTMPARSPPSPARGHPSVAPARHSRCARLLVPRRAVRSAPPARRLGECAHLAAAHERWRSAGRRPAADVRRSEGNHHSPDGKWASAGNPGAGLKLYPTAEGASPPLAGVKRRDSRVLQRRWTVHLCRAQADSAPDHYPDPRRYCQRRRSTWKTLKPADPAGIVLIGNVAFTPDGETVAFTTAESRGIFLVTGLQ